MTFEKILDDLTSSKISAQSAYDEMISKEKKKKINYYLHFNDIAKEPLTDGQLQELTSIVGILQILYNSDVDSPISDTDYDTLQEILIDMGIPRLTGSVELTSGTKVNHKYTKLRGTLDKVYYLSLDEKRINKSRKYLDEWIRSAESLYKKNTGKDIDLNKVKIMLQAKYDGASCILEVDEKFRWITRGDTGANLATDVTHIMDVFNDVYSGEPIGTGIKFEVMVSENDKDMINKLVPKPYKNSRQIVTATTNQNEPDFKVDYLHPIPLRVIHDGDDVEQIHPDMIETFPTEICTFGDREVIREFANKHRYVEHNGHRFRTDGVVMTILDDDIKIALGRDGNINNFEVAYKFTEEYAYTKVKDVEFDTSEFGYICPVLVVNDVILKGNRVHHISLSNKERFDELNLAYGDEVKVLYDIIPYVVIDDHCRRVNHGRKIEFINHCPRCGEPLDMNVVQVRCNNPDCPSRIIGRIQNYCDKLRIKNFGYSTLRMLYDNGILKHGIASLYKLKKHKQDIAELNGFGETKARKLISEVESRRKLNDYAFFGSLGIDGMSITTFETLFSEITLDEFMNMVKLKNFDLLRTKALAINGIGDATVDTLITALRDKKFMNDVSRILKEVTLYPSYGVQTYTNGRATFTGCRPDNQVTSLLESHGMQASGTWSDKLTKILVVPDAGYMSAKVATAVKRKIPVVVISDLEKFLQK